MRVRVRVGLGVRVRVRVGVGVRVRVGVGVRVRVMVSRLRGRPLVILADDGLAQRAVPGGRVRVRVRVRVRGLVWVRVWVWVRVRVRVRVSGQYQSPLGMSALRRGGMRHSKWKTRGHESQQRSSPGQSQG